MIAIKDTWKIDRVALPFAATVLSILALSLILWATGCSLSPQESNERAAREEYAKARAGCYETAGYWGDGLKGCMRDKGWRE